MTASGSETGIDAAGELMLAFAERTGLTSPRPPQRYLWTDAFAVCNFLGLARTTGEDRYSALALELVEQVHQVLGRHRPDGPRAGWLSGLDEREGAAHPTAGGLRIGKKLPERRPGEPLDERLEWDRDGQYFHYLTKWMHALDQVARATRQPRFNRWARELAAVGHRAFCYGAPGDRRMVWKMSSDLSRPLVASMGQHDALDGLITSVQLQATAQAIGGAAEGPSLTDIDMAADFATMIGSHDLSTVDPLGLGGLLTDAGRVDQLLPSGPLGPIDPENLLAALLAAALDGLPHYARQGDLAQPATRRLGFRELGLAIGLHAVTLMRERSGGSPRAGALGRDPAAARAPLAALERYFPLGTGIESFWLDPAHRQARTWSEHRDINEVMLATSLAPDGFLILGR